MKKFAVFFDLINQYFLSFILFIFPFFFLTITQEFFLTNKLYLLAFSSLFLLFISTIKFAVTKKISWQKGVFDSFLIIFLVSLVSSVIFSSPNKVQALLNPNFGLLTFFSLTILYFYLSRNKEKQTGHNLSLQILSTSSLFVSILTIIFFFQPFKNIDLPVSLQFLKTPNVNLFGSQLDLAIFLDFFVVFHIIQTLTPTNSIDKNEKSEKKSLIINASYLILTLTALFLTIYSLIKPITTNFNQFQPFSTNMPPFRLSWYTAVEILKNPVTAFFGVGVDNFSSIFTKVKDIAYNQSNLWQIYSFNYSHSAVLHLFAETGIFGLVTFFLFIFLIINQLMRVGSDRHLLLILFIYLLVRLFFFPPSLITWFLFFLLIAELSRLSRKDMVNHVSANSTKEIDLTELLPFYIATIIFSLIFIIGFGYLLARSYLSEYYFKKGIDGVAKNDAKQAYENVRQAIILNPFIERYRTNFSQLNLIIANNLASKATKDKPLSEQDKQNISLAIQSAISEAKVAVSLNDKKAQNWENLAQIYRNIIKLIQGADVWAISAYQRAIVVDPQNPVYRLTLGGIYYSLGNYDDANNLFIQAVSLKPDWPLAYYNLAWSYYQKEKYQEAVVSMENVLRFLDPKKDEIDYKKAKKELEEFKKKLPKEEEQSTQEGKTQPKLTLPSPIPTTIPEIKLPKEASPEAK